MHTKIWSGDETILTWRGYKANWEWPWNTQSSKLSFYSSYHIAKVVEIDNNELWILKLVDFPVWTEWYTHTRTHTHARKKKKHVALTSSVFNIGTDSRKDWYICLWRNKWQICHTRQEISLVPRPPWRLAFSSSNEICAEFCTASDQCCQGLGTRCLASSKWLADIKPLTEPPKERYASGSR